MAGSTWEEREGHIDIGFDHWIKFYPWAPDRDLNPQYADIPDIERCGLGVWHLKPDDSPCYGFIHFDTPDIRRVFGGDSFWTVESWEPLTVNPSLLCTLSKGGCGDHGWIKQGKWVKA